MFLVILAVAAPGVPGMVLCIGPDGHFSFEAAHEGRCHDTGGEAHHEAAYLPIDSNGCCGDCVDVPLSSDGMLPLVKKVKEERLDAPARTVLTATAVPETDLPDLRSHRVPDSGSGPEISPGLLAHRTVVLRT